MLRARSFLAILAAIAIVSASGPSLRAQPAPSSEAMKLANDLFALMSRDLLVEMTQQFTAQFWPQAEARLGLARDPGASAQLRTEYERILLDTLVAAMQDAPAIYARHFSAAELQDLIAFYRSPTGQKALRAMPAIMAESMALVFPRIQEIGSQAETAFRRVLRERGYIK